MFLAALDVRGAHKAWGRRRSEVEGAWDDVCRKARAHDGTTVISHELLAAASARQVTAALTMLKGLEVHVVVTARDPARQAAAEWQEGIKHGRRLTFDQFRGRVLEQRLGDRLRPPLPGLPGPARRAGPVGRHAAAVPRARRVLPAAGRRPALLWQRFGDVVGFDPEAFPPAGPDSANPSLGTVEIDLLRRVNVALDKRLVQPDVRPGRQAALRPGDPEPAPLAPSGRPARDVRRPGASSASGGPRRSTRRGTTCAATWPSLVPVAPGEAGPHPDDVPARGTRSTPPSPRPPSCCSRCSGAAARWPGSRPTTPGSARSASGSSGGCAPRHRRA